MASVINVTIYSEINEFPTEKRYDVNIKISDLKKKLELITGANHKSMKITMTVGDKKEIELTNDDEILSSYLSGVEISKDTNVELSVKDEHPSNLLEGDVPKYTISEEKYKERSNVRDFIKQTREKLEDGK